MGLSLSGYYPDTQKSEKKKKVKAALSGYCTTLPTSRGHPDTQKSEKEKRVKAAVYCFKMLH